MEFREALKKRVQGGRHGEPLALVQGRVCQQLPLDGQYAFDGVTPKNPLSWRPLMPRTTILTPDLTAEIEARRQARGESP